MYVLHTPYTCKNIYVKYYLVFVFGSLISGGQGFLLAFSAAGQARLPWVHMKHVWISAELRGGARRVKRH